jgi:hypothetical protein
MPAVPIMRAIATEADGIPILAIQIGAFASAVAAWLPARIQPVFSGGVIESFGMPG